MVFSTEKKLKKNLDRIQFLAYIIIMTESERIEQIKNMVANATKKVDPKFQGMLDDLMQEKLAEEFTLEHGTQHASDDEVKDEFVSLDAVENDKDDEDFDNDENLTDMDCVSGSMREIFGE